MIEYATKGYKELNGDEAEGGAMYVLSDWDLSDDAVVLFEGKAYEWGSDELVDAFESVKLLRRLLKGCREAGAKKILEEMLREVIGLEIAL